MKKNRHIDKHVVRLIIVICIFIGITIVVFQNSEPDRKIGSVPGSNAVEFAKDSTFRENRQMGLVNLDKFIALASRLGTTIFNPEENVRYKRDSVTITLATEKSNILFADYTNIGQTERLQGTYHDFPITILNRGTGFTAKMVKIDSLRYIRIPYLVLASLAEYVSGSTPERTRCESNTDNTISPSDFDALQNLNHGGAKIQTEGLVLRNFSDIQAVKNSDHNSDPVKQLEIAWQFVKEKWLYIYDPNTGTGVDTWRSASETISNYYSNGKCYTGDCDDFAILMASFARQVGLESRIKAVVKGDGGHAYAEFRRKNEKKWHNLDWFEDFDSPKRFIGDKEIVIDNI